MFGDPLDKQFSQSLLDAARKINDKTVADAKVAKEEKERLEAEDNSMIGQFDEARRSKYDPVEAKRMYDALTKHVETVKAGAERAKAKIQANPMSAKPVDLTNETEIDADLFTAEELTRIDEIIGRGLTGVFFNPASQLAAMAQYGTGIRGHGSVRSSGNSRSIAPAHDEKDEEVRRNAKHAYATAKHAENVTAAGDNPNRHDFNPNQSINSKAKHSSSPAKNTAVNADTLHRDVVKSLPNEYAISPSRAITAHLQKTGASQTQISRVHEYDKHYRAAKGLGESVDKDAEHRKGVRDAEDDFKKKAPKGSSVWRKRAFAKAKRGDL